MTRRCWCVRVPASAPAAADLVTSQFIHLICFDAELDFSLSRLLILFGVDLPETYGGYAHHVSGR